MAMGGLGGGPTNLWTVLGVAVVACDAAIYEMAFPGGANRAIVYPSSTLCNKWYSYILCKSGWMTFNQCDRFTYTYAFTPVTA